VKVKQAAHLPFKLNETGQINPLRWSILYLEEDGSYENQTGEFKCKDYFNDVVAKYNGFVLNVHGMNFEHIKLNTEGVYVRLSRLKWHAQLKANLQLIRDNAVENGLPPLNFSQDGAHILIFIPKVFFSSTYQISYLTYLIRMAHCDKVFTSIRSLVEANPYTQVDNPLGRWREHVLRHGYKPAFGGWTFLGDSVQVTQENKTKWMYCIHNAGCQATLTMLNIAGRLTTQEEMAV